MTRTLDCGHNPTPDSKPGTGYAFDQESGQTLCYACADDMQRGQMATAERFTLYVSSDGKRLTSWSGGNLARVTGHTVSRSGFNRSEIHRWWARDANGRNWYGSNSGTGMVLTVRKVKP